MFVTYCNSPVKVQNICETTNFFINYFLSRTGVVTTKADSHTIADDAKVMKGSTNWHLGYGADLQVGYQLTSCLKLGIYSGLTRLTGERMDGMPEHLHKNNFVWESGVRLGFSLPFNNHQQ